MGITIAHVSIVPRPRPGCPHRRDQHFYDFVVRLPGLSDIHTALVGLQIYTAHDLMLKVSFGLLVLALLVVATCWHCADSVSLLVSGRPPRIDPAHAVSSSKATRHSLSTPLAPIRP
jgi:hypothetical protein